MKHALLTIVLMLCVMQAVQAKERVVERPPFVARNTTTIEINKIVMSDRATVFFIDAFFRPNNWIRIDEATYLNAGGKKIPVKYGDGIELGKEFWMPDSGEASFKLVFPPLPKGIKEIDFIETDCETCFKIWGIRVDGEPLPALSIDKEWTANRPDYNAPMETPKIEKGNAVLSGKLLEYRPEMKFSGKLHGSNIIPITSIEQDFTVNDDGTFRVEFPLVAPARIYMVSPFYRGDLILRPNQETNLLFNLREIARSDSKLRKDEQSYGQKVYVRGGAYAALNDEMINRPINVFINPLSQQEYNDMLTNINGMTPAQYKTYWMNRYQQAIDKVNATPGVSDNYKKIYCLNLNLTLFDQLLSASGMLQDAYKKANNIDRRMAAPGFKLADYPADYYDVVKTLEINSPFMLLCDNYSYMPLMLEYANLENKKENPYGIFEYLLESGKLKEDESALVKEYVASQKSGTPFNKEDELMSIRRLYDSLFQEYAKKQQAERNTRQVLARLLGTDKGLLFDLMDIRPLSGKITQFQPLTDEDLEKAARVAPVYKEVLAGLNEDVLRKIEENKKKSGYTVNEVPQVPNEELFEAIVSKYKGKVIFIDFWATWCGPCRSAMKEAEPVKKALAGKDIVYLYLTGPSSPLETWNNMIPDIHGEHYRLAEEQWNHLCYKFGVNGVPSYLLVGRDGKPVHFQIAFMGAEKMKEMLLKEVEKK